VNITSSPGSVEYASVYSRNVTRFQGFEKSSKIFFQFRGRRFWPTLSQVGGHSCDGSDIRRNCHRLLSSVATRGRCYDHNFLRFLPISAKKMAFFSKTNVMITILEKLTVVWAKNAKISLNFSAKIFKNHNIGPSAMRCTNNRIAIRGPCGPGWPDWVNVRYWAIVFLNIFVANAPISPFNTQTMYIK
jgi:hypothetical protein